jgi:hypothetical protein
MRVPIGKCGGVLLVIAAAVQWGCVAPSKAQQDSQAVRGLRLRVSPEVKVGSPALSAEATRMKDALEQELRVRGYAPAAADGSLVGVLQLSLDRTYPEGWQARLDLLLPSGEPVESVSVKRTSVIPESDQQIDQVVGRLVTKLKGSWLFREFASNELTTVID